jgi:dTDP-4-amino-4,6-dideoxygalactose transaminase
MIARIRPETQYTLLLQSIFSGRDYKTILAAELKAYFGVEEVLFTNGGRVGLYYLLKALPQRKVYLPAYTCWAVPEAIRHAGKELVFVDIKLTDYNMDIDKLSEILASDSIILATHQFGIPCDMDAINTLAKEKKCLVLEDNAAGFGSTYKGKKTGTFSPASIISFEFSKTLTCGKGGAVLFNDRDLYLKVKEIYDRETTPPRYPETIVNLSSLAGYLLITNNNFYDVTHWLFDKTKGITTGYPPPDSVETSAHYRSGFDNVRAKLTHCGMKYIDQVIARKIGIAKYYLDELATYEKIALPAYPDDKVPVFMRFPVRINDVSKEDFYTKCVKKRVDLAFTFSYSCEPDIHRAPHSHKAAETVLNLPVYSKLTDNDLQKIKEVILTA